MGFALSRIGARLAGIAGVLLLIFTWRVDQAVRTAYSSGWKAPALSPQGKRLDCGGCRLPSDTWIWIHASLGATAIVLLVLALVLWRLRSQTTTGSALELDLFVGFVSAIAIVVAGTSLFVFRRPADLGQGSGKLGWAVFCDFATLGLLALIALAIVITCAAPEDSFVDRLRRFFQRHRVNLVGVVAFAIILTLVSKTSGQAIDSIRTWVVDSPHGHARLAFGLATSLLLALTVYESSLRLDQFQATPDGSQASVSALTWFLAAVVVGGGGLLLHFLADFGWGLAVSGGILLLLAGLESIRLSNPRATEVAAVREPPTAVPPGAAAAASLVPPDAPIPPLAAAALAPAAQRLEEVAEYLAIIPLLSIAAITIAAAVDSALSGGEDPAPFWVLAPGLGLAAVAVLFTSSRAEPDLRDPPLKRWLIAAAAVTAIILMLAFGLPALASSFTFLAADTWNAVFGFALFGLGLVYAAALFHAPRTWIERHDSWLLALPAALVTGAVVAVLLHLKLHGVADALGVFGLVNLALAFLLAALHYAVQATLHRRAPWLLWWFGIEQLPLLSVIAACWIGAGLLSFPATTHDVRLTARQPVAGLDPTAPAAHPSLQVAFDQWRTAQPDLAGSGTGAPVPLVAVAGHGGGIRAAYWTALALDCIVRVSPRGFDPAKARPDDPATCGSSHRTAAEQQFAARRIFLASGVSGGAVGLYSYARKLLADESLGDDGSWIKSQLGGDFASDTIGWGLFHDVPNHILGLHPKAGGVCRMTLNGQCETEDREAALEDAFDRVWPKPAPELVQTWQLRAAGSKELRAQGEMIPLLVMNATVTGGNTRALVTAADLAAWPKLETVAASGGNALDAHPLAGTVDVSDVLCGNADLRLSSAALLASRFPYISPSGRLEGGCPRPPGRDVPKPSGDCLRLRASDCAVSVVDGGYIDNSGLFTIVGLWPSLRQMVIDYNGSTKGRKVALVLIEIDNHYRPTPAKPASGTGRPAETFVPLNTALGGRTAMETYARADAYRLTPPGCTVTISPPLHPGLTAPLGWELSRGAQTELRDALVRPPPNAKTPAEAIAPVLRLRRLQEWLGEDGGVPLSPSLSDCVPSSS
jgi:hypothetical protein